MNETKQSITIDNIEYPIADLNDNAKAQVTNLRIIDQKIAQTQQDLAIYQTARSAYAQALKKELPKK
jgi:hypothetical protein